MVLLVLLAPVVLGAFLLVMERLEAALLGIAPLPGVADEVLAPDSGGGSQLGRLSPDEGGSSAASPPGRA
jgi:hypothetical protein